MNFLDHLPLAPAEKAKLRQLAVPSPSALLGLIHASPDAFAQFFGPAHTEQLVDWLNAMIDERERARLSRSVHHYPIQGSVFSINPAPSIAPTKYNIEKRDRLFDHLQQLRTEPNPSDQTRQEIAEYEAKLNAILD